MASNYENVLLGYQDEPVNEKHKGQVNFMVNKIGGEPDYPSNSSTAEKNPPCLLCHLPSRLVVQVYAPLDNCSSHRTLFLFACINPSCWNRSESWKCLRTQSEKVATLEVEQVNAGTPKLSATDWCADADDWGDDETNANSVEENPYINVGGDKGSEDEESSSFELSVQSSFVGLSIDDKNVNIGTQGGAVGKLHSPMATAEIEGHEGEVITVEPPTTPRTNLAALLHETPPLPQGTSGKPDTAPFRPYFMSVWPEQEGLSNEQPFDNHVKELLAEYQRKDKQFSTTQQEGQRNDKSSGDVEMAAEEYEKSNPLHGDKMFHHYLTKIKENPQQILRYNREGPPLLLYPLQEPLPSCRYCRGEVVFEFQLVSTIISKLRLDCDLTQCNRLEFGTVLVYTCKQSCWSSNDSAKEEVIVVQKENY